MLYLGEYDEETAKEIKAYLDEAGLKVETRSCLVMEDDVTYTIKDRLSGIRELMKEDSDRLDRYDRYISALKSVLPRATSDDFNDLFLKEVDPLMVEKREKILALNRDKQVEDQQVEDQQVEDQQVEDQQAENPQSLTSEEETIKFGTEEWLDNALSISRASSFAAMVLSLNDIKIGEAVDNKLDDPIIEINVDPDDYETRPEQINCDIDFFMDKSVIIFVDEFTTPLASDLDDEFWDEYPSEAQRLKSLGLLIEKLAMSPSSRKMDFAEFAEECNITLEDEGSFLNIYGGEVAGDLARVLEKSGVLKWKGDKLKWKSNN